MIEDRSGSPMRPIESLTLIDRYTTVEGTLVSSRDIRIEGELRGTLQCEGAVHVAEGGRVDATVEAGAITVAGQLRGSITCRGKLHILRTGRVTGSITTNLLVIEEGGRCGGELAMGSALAEASLPSASRGNASAMLPESASATLESTES
jgi:cytoskeletal protein CcmA (bactofilin family)